MFKKSSMLCLKKNLTLKKIIDKLAKPKNLAKVGLVIRSLRKN